MLLLLMLSRCARIRIIVTFISTTVYLNLKKRVSLLSWNILFRKMENKQYFLVYFERCAADFICCRVDPPLLRLASGGRSVAELLAWTDYFGNSKDIIFHGCSTGCMQILIVMFETIVIGSFIQLQ